MSYKIKHWKYRSPAVPISRTMYKAQWARLISQGYACSSPHYSHAVVDFTAGREAADVTYYWMRLACVYVGRKQARRLSVIRAMRRQLDKHLERKLTEIV